LFIKTTKVKNYEYIKLVESYWEDGKSKHRVLYNFGRLDLIKKDESFLRAVKKLCELAEIPVEKESGVIESDLLDNSGEAEIYNYGYLAYLKLWKTLGIEDAVGYGSEKIRHSVSDTIFLMAAQHLLDPRSKLATCQRQNRYLCLKEISLQHMYRALDRLSDHKEEIEESLFEHNYVQYGQTVDVVFYDVTTFAFESVIADAMKDFGYSKACKFNEVQVVLGMIIDSNGMPVGFELFPGNTTDGKTMPRALENIKRLRFGIDRVIVVADRGLNCKDNLNLVKDAGHGYIMSSKIKGMDKKTKDRILSPEGFIVVKDAKGNEVFRYKTLPYTNVYKDENNVTHMLDENLIITYSPKRAKKDQADRERLVEKAKALLESPGKIDALNKRGGKKYIDKPKPKKKAKPKNPADPEKTAEPEQPANTEQPAAWRLDVKKIEQDSKFDGFYGIQTSEKNMTAEEITEAYHTLWKIEESFRIMKSTLETRPVFHWTPKRIRGHFVVCFLAFLMERKLELMLAGDKDGTVSSPARIQESLNNMQVVSVSTDRGPMFIKAKADPLCNKIFKLLGLNMPLNISAPHELFDRLKLPEEPVEVQLSLF